MFCRDYLLYWFHYNAPVLFVVFDVIALRFLKCCLVDSWVNLFIFNQTPTIISPVDCGKTQF